MSGKNKDDKPRRRRSKATVSGLTNMQYAAGAVALWGPALLEKLPHGFDNIEAGKKDGKLLAWWKNKRVLIVLGLLVYCIQSDKLSTRLWSIPLAALLGLAVTQHRMTYGTELADTDVLVEAFP